MNATERTLRELALENPAATRVFEKLHLDYCCGGGQTLQQACDRAGLPVASVLDSLTERPAAPARDWGTEPLSALTAHIRDTHHRFTRAEIARIAPLFDKVCAAHAERHPELLEERQIFLGLADELTSHLMKEERILFPYIEQLEASHHGGAPAPASCFGSVRNPVAMMMHEHDGAGEALAALRRLSRDYTAPADACLSFQTLYGALAGLEADLHQHIHLENNILFPKAIALEGGVQ